MKDINAQGILTRFIFALILVLSTYNPTQYSYYNWFKTNYTDFTPLLALAGITLLIGWIIYIRATMRSLGLIGLTLAAAFFGCIIWLFIDQGFINIEKQNVITWIILILFSAVLSIGMSWSHIRRRISGQLDTDDVDEN